jgi:hypothetical protein
MSEQPRYRTVAVRTFEVVHGTAQEFTLSCDTTPVLEAYGVRHVFEPRLVLPPGRYRLEDTDGRGTVIRSWDDDHDTWAEPIWASQ